MPVRTLRRIASLSFTTNHKCQTPFFLTALYFSSTPVKYSAKADQLNRSTFTHEIDSRISFAVANSENPEKAHSVMSFFKESGFSDTQLEHIVKKVPKVLSSNLEQTVKPKIRFFQDLGLSPDQIATAISAYPRTLKRSEHSIQQSYLVLKGLFGSNFEDERFLRYFMRFHCHDVEKSLVPNFEFLKTCGVPHSQLMKACYNYPRFLLRKPEIFKEYVRRVDEMGVARESKMFVYAVRTLSTMTTDNWEQKLDIFRSSGLSESDILSMFRRIPNVFSLSKRKIKDMTDFLLRSGKYDFSFIFKNPGILIYSIDGRVKPRLRVLEILDDKEILKFKPRRRMFTVFSMSDAEFFDKYVSPYLKEVKELSFMDNKQHATQPI